MVHEVFQNQGGTWVKVADDASSSGAFTTDVSITKEDPILKLKNEAVGIIGTETGVALYDSQDMQTGFVGSGGSMLGDNMQMAVYGDVALERGQSAIIDMTSVAGEGTIEMKCTDATGLYDKSLTISADRVSFGAYDLVDGSRKVNDKALSSDVTLDASDVGAVPTTRKVNDKALSSDITLSASDVNAVPQSGGDMSGGIRFTANNSNVVYSSSDGNLIWLSGGTGVTSGASIKLAGKDNGEAGAFQIRAHDGTNYSALYGKADGTLTWGGKNVIRDNGSISQLYYEGSSGGIAIGSKTTDRYWWLCGGTNGGNGASLGLCGKDLSSTDASGHFRLKAANSSTNMELRGWPDGRLLWGGRRITPITNAIPTAATTYTKITLNTDGTITLGN